MGGIFGAVFVAGKALSHFNTVKPKTPARRQDLFFICASCTIYPAGFCADYIVRWFCKNAQKQTIIFVQLDEKIFLALCSAQLQYGS